MFFGIGLLTYLAMAEDRRETNYQLAVRSADRDAERIKELAKAKGIPQTGAVALLRDDSYSQGPRIFSRNCASCQCRLSVSPRSPAFPRVTAFPDSACGGSYQPVN